MDSTATLNVIDLCRYDYLILDPGYITRLFDKIDDMNEQARDEESDQPALMFFVDYNYNSKTYNKVEHQADSDGVYETLIELLEYSRKIKGRFNLRGAVCFKEGNYDVTLEKMIEEYQHCGGFDAHHPCVVASFLTKNGKRVVYKSYGTESG